ncbi:hypothetical protein [Streptomyces sp. NPDC006739]
MAVWAIGWTYAMGAELTDTDFDAGVLSSSAPGWPSPVRSG